MHPKKNSSTTRLIFLCSAALCCLWLMPKILMANDTRPRIISLYAAHTEVLLRLGARDNIIGVSAQETYQGPENEGWEPNIFSIRDDAEKFLAAQPDIVLLRPMHMASANHLVTSLQAAGIQVRAEQVVKAADLYKYWRNLAKIVKREAEAEKMIREFDEKITIYHNASKQMADNDKPGVFLEAIHEQVKTFTPDSLPAWLLELAGGKNVAADAKAHAKGLFVANYGLERLLTKANQVDIFISQEGAMNRATLKRIKNRKIYKPIKAFKNDHVYKIAENIISRPTPSLIQGLEQLAAITGLQDQIDSQKEKEEVKKEP